MAFSMEKGNLYQGDNIHGAENIYKEKRDRVFDNIISEGMATQNPKAREDYRARLREKIKEGFIDREYLSKHGWNEDRVLITSEIVDFLIPQIKPNTEEEKIEPIIKQIDGVILPTENGNGPEAGNGVGMAEKRLIPRFELLVNFLKENKITEDNYLCYRGGNEKDMMRQESYVMFVIPDLKKMVLTCDEEGNATYIIHNAPTKKEFEKLKRNEEVAESERSPSFYYKMTKNDLLFLIKELGIVSSKKWDEEKWLEKIEDELTKEVNFAFKAEDIKKLLEQAKNQKNIEKSALEPVPPGWLTNQTLADQLGVNFLTVRRAADKYNRINTEWFKFFLDVNNKAYNYYSPELVALIKKELTKYEPAPSGWLTVHGVAAKLAIDRKTVKRITEKHLKIDRDQIRLFKAETGKIYDYYSPELIAKIKQDLLKSKADGKIAP